MNALRYPLKWLSAGLLIIAATGAPFVYLVNKVGTQTLSQDLDRHFERLPLLVQRRYLQFDPCDRGD